MDRRRPSQDKVLQEQQKSYDLVDAFKTNSMDGLNGRLTDYHKKFPIFAPVKDAKENAILCLQMYQEQHLDRVGMPVAIICEINKKKYVLEASQSVDAPLNSVDFLEKQFPLTIESKTSALIFYMQEFSIGTDTFRFESSLHKGFCLALNPEKKLILKRTKSTDETQAFYFSESN